MNEHGRRCHDRAGTALLDVAQTHLGEFSADWHPTRSLSPGSRGQATGRAGAPSLSGRTDHGGLVTDGGSQVDCSAMRYMSTQEVSDE